MKSNYLAKASALPNSRIPSLQSPVSKLLGHQLENHDPGPTRPCLRWTPARYADTSIHLPCTPQSSNTTSPAEAMKMLPQVPNTV